MAAPGRKTGDIQRLWAIAKSPELKLSDEDVHAVVLRETGKTSIRELTAGELGQVVRELQQMKDRAGGRKRSFSGRPETLGLRSKIHALEKELGWDDDPKRLAGFVKRVTRVERLEWLSPKQCSQVIEGLKAMLKRKEGQDGSA